MQKTAVVHPDSAAVFLWTLPSDCLIDDEEKPLPLPLDSMMNDALLV